MRKRFFIALGCLAMHTAQAEELLPTKLIAEFTLCEKADVGDFQYDLKIKGNQQLGLISGTADSTHQRLCANNINLVGQYGLQADGTYLATMTTLTGDTGNCDAWVYQFVWNVDTGTGNVIFLNDQVEGTELKLGACATDSGQ